MSVSYGNCFIDKKMNRTDLKNVAGISFNVLAKMGKGETVSMENISKCAKHSIAI